MPMYTVFDVHTAQHRLVDAPNPAQALRHVTAQQFVVKAASAKTVAELMMLGVKLETVATKTETQEN